MQENLSYPQANLSLDKKGLAYYSATCPSHLRTSHKMMGGQQDLEKRKFYWTFHCNQNIAGSKQGHSFLALPDKHAPETGEEWEIWKAKQVAARLNPYLKGLR